MTTDPVRNLLDRLDDVKDVGGGKWMARCPAHEDRHQSLSVAQGDDGRALVNCHAKCGFSAIVAAAGLKPKDLFMHDDAAKSKPAKPKGPGRIAARYPYVDEAGELLFEAVRFDPKGFRQRRPDGSGGWVWKLDGVRRVPFRLPELLDADPEAWAFVPEGEKDVDALRRAGLVATCNPMGAGKWPREFGEYLAGRRVCVLPDNDDPGRAHAADVARSCAGRAASVRVLALPGLPPKGDVSDWLAAGGTPAGLVALADDADEWSPTSDTRTALAAPPPDETPDCPDPDGWEPDRLSQQANAEQLVTELAGRARFNVSSGAWMTYAEAEGRYVPDETGVVTRAAKRVARRTWDFVAEPPEGLDHKAAFKHAVDSERAAGIAAAMKLAQTQTGIPVAARDFDRDPFHLNVMNGTVDLRTGKLMPHGPDRLLTKLAPVTYDAAAACPLWDRFMSRIMDDDHDMVAYLRRLAGLCLTGDATVQELWIPWGGGANGKSVFFDTLSGLMGDYAGIAPDSLLTARAMGSEHPTEVAGLCGKRMVVASETEEGAKLRIQLVKRLTGDATITARFMRQDFFEFPRTHKLVMVTNNRPVIRETTNAVWRRVRLIPFTVTIPKAERDPQLLPKLQAERAGILNWCVRGCLDWQAGGMQTPEPVLLATTLYQDQQDDMGEFVAERLVLGDHCTLTRADAWTAYQEYAKGTDALDRTAFFDRIRRLPNVEETMRRVNGVPTRVFTGIGLATLAEQYRRDSERVAAMV
ncbi:MAG: phage/plasmid primase, family [Phycisphaerales bacterium]|nr:phage/plasmid primase, family [Phycisphaerales bacterium]